MWGCCHECFGGFHRQLVDAGEEAAAAGEQTEVKAVQEDENEEDEEGNEETALAAAASPLPHVAPKPKHKRSVQWVGKPLDNQASGGTRFYGCARLHALTALCGMLQICSTPWHSLDMKLQEARHYV